MLFGARPAESARGSTLVECSDSITRTQLRPTIGASVFGCFPAFECNSGDIGIARVEHLLLSEGRRIAVTLDDYLRCAAPKLFKRDLIAVPGDQNVR